MGNGFNPIDLGFSIKPTKTNKRKNGNIDLGFGGVIKNKQQRDPELDFIKKQKRLAQQERKLIQQERLFSQQEAFIREMQKPKPIESINVGSSFDTMSSFKGSGSIKAGSSFDTSNAFKGLLSTSKGGNQDIKISKDDIAKIRAGIQRFSGGGESLGKRLRGKKKDVTPKTTTSGISGKVVMIDDNLQRSKSVPKLKDALSSSGRVSNTPTAAQGVLSGLRQRFGLR